MSVVLRLSRAGAKKMPYYHIVAADSRCPRDGKFIEAIGAYEQALRVSPFDPTTRCGLAEAYSQTKDPRAARERSACDELKHN